MAKMQKATLDPSKISGYCGRLKCCLRYEDQTYMDLKQSLPRKGTMVQTKRGSARVVDTQILTQLVVIEYENGEKAAFTLDELAGESGPGGRQKPPQAQGRARLPEPEDEGDNPEDYDVKEP